jgi:putative transposase
MRAALDQVPWPAPWAGKQLVAELALKNRVLKKDCWAQEISRFVDYYNHQRYHGSLGNVTPADGYFGRAKEVQSRREEIKRRTLEARRQQHTQLLRMAA